MSHTTGLPEDQTADMPAIRGWKYLGDLQVRPANIRFLHGSRNSWPGAIVVIFFR
jgi:hypothetical protein